MIVGRSLELSALRCSLTDRFRRVFDDDEGRVHRCDDCDTYARLNRGPGVGIDVAIPVPETSTGCDGDEIDA